MDRRPTVLAVILAKSIKQLFFVGFSVHASNLPGDMSRLHKRTVQICHHIAVLGIRRTSDRPERRVLLQPARKNLIHKKLYHRQGRRKGGKFPGPRLSNNIWLFFRDFSLFF